MTDLEYKRFLFRQEKLQKTVDADIKPDASFLMYL